MDVNIKIEGFNPIKLTVGLGRTLSTGKFESVRPYFSLEGELDEGADIWQIKSQLVELLEAMIDDEAPKLIAHQTPRQKQQQLTKNEFLGTSWHEDGHPVWEEHAHPVTQSASQPNIPPALAEAQQEIRELLKTSGEFGSTHPTMQPNTRVLLAGIIQKLGWHDLKNDILDVSSKLLARNVTDVNQVTDEEGLVMNQWLRFTENKAKVNDIWPV